MPVGRQVWQVFDRVKSAVPWHSLLPLWRLLQVFCYWLPMVGLVHISSAQGKYSELLTKTDEVHVSLWTYVHLLQLALHPSGCLGCSFSPGLFFHFSFLKANFSISSHQKSNKRCFEYTQKRNLVQKNLKASQLLSLLSQISLLSSFFYLSKNRLYISTNVQNNFSHFLVANVFLD